MRRPTKSCGPLLTAVILFQSITHLHAADPASAPQQSLDLTYIPTDAVAAVVANPSHMFAGPQADLYPTEVISLAGKKYLGFDPLTIGQALAVIGLPDPAVATRDPQPRLAFALRFSAPIDPAIAALKIVPTGHDADLNSVKARIATRPNDLSCAIIDNRTLIISSEADLHWIMSAQPGDSPLRKLMSAADSAPCAQVFVAIEPLRPLLAPAIVQASQRLPPPLQGLTKLPTLIDTVTISAQQITNEGLEFLAVFASPNEQSARDLEGLVRQVMEFGRTAFLTQMSGEMTRNSADDPEIANAMMHYLGRLSEKTIASLTPTRDGNQVKIRVVSPSGPASVGVAVALILPAIQAAREAARRVSSSNSMKEIALALLNYDAAHKHLPARANFNKQGQPLLSWRVQILPFLEEQELYNQFHLDEPWDSEHNKPLIEKMPHVFADPRYNLEPGKTVYQAVTGPGTVFDGDTGLRLAQISDGTSKTAAMVEVGPDHAIPWTKPADWQFDPDHPLNGLANSSPGGVFNVVFLDGHVEAFTADTPPNTIKSISLRDDEAHRSLTP